MFRSRDLNAESWFIIPKFRDYPAEKGAVTFHQEGNKVKGYEISQLGNFKLA